MTHFLLDTNHLSPLVTIGHPMREKVALQIANGDDFTIPTIVLSEFMFGIGGLPRAIKNQQEWSRLQADFSYVDFDKKLAENAAALRLSLQKKGWQLALFDALIAVTAIRGQYTLLTTDKDFQEVPNISLENWLS